MNRTAKRAGQNIQLATVDDLFGLDNETAAINGENGIAELPVNELHTFQNHPYKVIPDDEAMRELIESIQEHGVLVPLDVRPRSEGGHEIISGHRRQFAAMQAGLQTVPCIISPVDDDTAVLRMVDSNLYRPDILPSEKAFAYKMKLAALKRQGKRTDLTSSQIGTQKRSDQLLAEQTGESRNQVQRYIRLTYLSPELLAMVDAKKIPLNVGVTISYLDEMRQIWFHELIGEIGHCPTLGQAEKLKKYQTEHKLTKEVMEVILSEEAGAGPSISIKTKSIEKYFPPDTGKQEMEETILKLLENWMNRRT